MYSSSLQSGRSTGQLLHVGQCLEIFDPRSKGIQHSFCIGLQFRDRNQYLKAESADIFNEWLGVKMVLPLSPSHPTLPPPHHTPHFPIILHTSSSLLNTSPSHLSSHLNFPITPHTYPSYLSLTHNSYLRGLWISVTWIRSQMMARGTAPHLQTSLVPEQLVSIAYRKVISAQMSR